MRGFLTAYVKGKTKTLKYEFAVAAFAVWIAVTLRVFLSGDASWIAAQGVNYATITTTTWLFITAAVGLQAFQNMQGSSPAPAAPDYENGAAAAIPTGEDSARSVG